RRFEGDGASSPDRVHSQGERGRTMVRWPARRPGSRSDAAPREGTARPPPSSHQPRARHRPVVALGLRHAAIARRRRVSEGTVKSHLHHVYEKLGVNSRMDLLLLAQQKGLKWPPSASCSSRTTLPSATSAWRFSEARLTSS